MGRNDGVWARTSAGGNTWALSGRADAGAEPLAPRREGAGSHTAGTNRGVAHAWARGRRWLILLAAECAALLIPVAFHATYRAPGLRAALETMMTLFALAGAWLLRAQFEHSRHLRDLLLLGAVATLGLSNLATRTLPAVLNVRFGNHFAAAHLWGELVAGSLFAAAAFAPADCLMARARHPISIIAAVSIAAVVIAELAGLVLSAEVLGGTTRAAAPGFVALKHPLGLLLVLGTAGLLGLAAAGYPRQHWRRADGVAALLTGAAVLLAAASLHALAPGSFAAGQIAASDALRAIAFAMILAAASRQELHARERMAKAAALSERRRVACDLHDGLAQDLAFIAAHGSRIAREMGEEHPMVVAARRALEISRGTIADLSDPAGATVHESLEAVAQELRNRFEIAVAVEARLDRDLAPEARESVTRIAREAIANAARHGGARTVIVSLRRADSGITLRIVDDGCGLGGTERGAPLEGFGLRSMRQRAAASGGSLSVRQPRRGGTELEVLLP